MHTPLTTAPPAAAPALPFLLLRLFTHSMPGAQYPLPAPLPPHGSPSPRAHIGQQPHASRVSPSRQPRGGRGGQEAGSQGPQTSEEEEEGRGRSRSSSPAAPKSKARRGGRSIVGRGGGGGEGARVSRDLRARALNAAPHPAGPREPHPGAASVPSPRPGPRGSSALLQAGKGGATAGAQGAGARACGARLGPQSATRRLLLSLLPFASQAAPQPLVDRLSHPLDPRLSQSRHLYLMYRYLYKCLMY